MNVELMVKNWHELIRPRRIQVEDDLTDTYGEFGCAPLERGFGLTLANALRRVLLSSLPGSAVTSLLSYLPAPLAVAAMVPPDPGIRAINPHSSDAF